MPYVPPVRTTNTVPASDHATVGNDMPGRTKMTDTNKLNSTGKMSTPGNHRRMRYAHIVRGLTFPEVCIYADRMQKAICIATSNVRTTATVEHQGGIR